MKITVLGSTGNVGRELVAQALHHGHHVTACTRSATKFDRDRERLRVVEGDVLDQATVDRAVKGRDAVICALGTPPLNNREVRANGTQNIIEAMNKAGVKRLVCLSAFGVGESRPMLPFLYRYLVIPTMLRRVFADHERQEGLVKQSDLDWILVRPGSFSAGAHTGIYRHGFTASDKPAALKISHADVADFMLKQLADNHYVGRAPGLSY